MRRIPPALLLMLIATTLCIGRTSGEEKPNSDHPAAKADKSAVQKNADKPAGNPHEADDESGPKKELFSGKVVLLTDAFEQRGIKTSAKEHQGQVVLETSAGELIPIVADWRGRAFYQDQRLRDRPVDLVGYRREGVPYLNVLMIFVDNDKGEREYMDYWCDICSIPMYEIKPCDCCQAPIRLRFQPRELPAYLHLDAGRGESGKPAPVEKGAAKTQAEDGAKGK